MLSWEAKGFSRGILKPELSGSAVLGTELLLSVGGEVLVLGDFGGGDPPSSSAVLFGFFEVLPGIDFPVNIHKYIYILHILHTIIYLTNFALIVIFTFRLAGEAVRAVAGALSLGLGLVVRLGLGSAGLGSGGCSGSSGSS